MDKFLSSRCHVNKNKVKKSIFFYFFFNYVTSSMDVSREQSRPVNCKFLKTKVTLLIWRIIISMIMIKVQTNSSITATNKRNFRANWRAIKAMNKKESWIIDKKYFNCESMTLCLQRKANIRKLICNKKTKELPYTKIKT